MGQLTVFQQMKLNLFSQKKVLSYILVNTVLVKLLDILAPLVREPFNLFNVSLFQL